MPEGARITPWLRTISLMHLELRHDAPSSESTVERMETSV